MRYIYIFLLGALLSVTNAFAHGPQAADGKTYHWMKFKASDKHERSRIADLGVTIEAIVEDHVMAIGQKEDLEAARKTGQLLMDFPLTRELMDFPGHDSQFHNYAELMQALRDLAAQYPSLVTLSSLGQSLEGRDIPLVTISTEKSDSSRPAIFFLGGHHAREHVSVETPLQLAQYLAREHASGNSRIVQLLANRTVYIAPLINPDGAEHDIASGRYLLWRKNRRENGNSAYGVDLNRNYGFGWGGGGASTNPRHDTFRGPSAFSEPETQAVKAFVESRDNITTLLSFHTFSELILYPWGHTYDSIQNQRDYLVHKTMAETMAQWNGYTPQQSSDLYIASGDTTDWAYGELGLISFTFELDPKATPDKNFFPERGFYPGQSYIEPVFRKNLEPCLYLIEYSDNPYRVIEPKFKRYGLNHW